MCHNILLKLKRQPFKGCLFSKAGSEAVPEQIVYRETIKNYSLYFQINTEDIEKKKRIISMKKRIIGIILFIIVFAGAILAEPAGDLTSEGMKALAVLLMAVILWITEPMPAGATAIFIMILPMLLGISTFRQTIAPFANPTIFFVIATFGLSAAIAKVPLAKRILLLLLKLLGESIEKIIFALIIATALISSVMSNIPATLMFMGVALSLLDLYDTDEEKCRTGRTLMIALPLAGMMGGSITPAGSSNNLLALSLLHDNAGTAVSFVDWIAVCLPVSVLMLPIAWFILIKIFKPAPVRKERLNEFLDELRSLPKPEAKEYIVMVIYVSMITLWILSSWFPVLDTTVVAIIGLAVMFLPGIDLFTWKEFSEEVSWSTILMTGSVLCIGSLINTSGVASWFADSFFSIQSGGSMFFLILQLALFMFVMQVILPNGPAAITATAVPVIAAAQAAQINPSVLVIPLTFFCSWAMILPLNPVPMLTYSKGYYKVTDIGKAGIPVLIILSLIMALWVPFITELIF